MRKLLLLSLCGSACVAHAATYSLSVPAGEAMGLSEVLAASNVAAIATGDVIDKYGAGRLVATNTYNNVVYAVNVHEGVYEARQGGDLGKDGSSFRVHSGATLLLSCSSNSALGNKINFYAEGTGCELADVPGTGAIVIKSPSNYRVLTDCSFILDSGDATFYTTVDNSVNGCFTEGHIDCNGNLLTFKTDNTTGYTHGFRFRLGAEILNATSGIVLDHASISASTATKTFRAEPVVKPVILSDRSFIVPDDQASLDMFTDLRFDPGSGITSSAELSIPDFTGFPNLGSCTPTIGSTWSLRTSDIVSSSKLNCSKAITFGDSAQLSIPADALLSLDVSRTRTIATSSVSITGTPRFVPPLGASPNWCVALSDDKNLTLRYDATKIPAGVVNVRNWGIAPGSDKAAANTAAFNQNFANLGDGQTLFFPQGEYHFSEPLAVGGKTGLTILGDSQSATVRVADEEAAWVIAVDSGSGLTITGLKLTGGAGVAVAAWNVAGVAVTNNTFDAIEGAIEDMVGNYPVYAIDCTEVFVSDNAILGGKTYAALAYVSGGTVIPGSEPQATNVIIRVAGGMEEQFMDAFARTGLAAYPQNALLVKRGEGLLYGTNAVSQTMSGVLIEEGTFVVRGDNEAGIAAKAIEVRSGATLRVVAEASNAVVLQNRTISLAGGGASGLGALDFRGSSWQIMSGWTLRLLDDATMSIRNASGDVGAFSNPTMYLDGHTLSIYGNYSSSNANLRWRQGANIASGGTIAMDKVLMSSSYPVGSGFRKDPNCQGDVVLSVDKGSRLSLGTSHLLSMFDRIDFETNALLNVGYNSSAAATTATFKSVSGVPTYTANASVTETLISESLVARAADLVAGRGFTAPNALTFGEGAKIEVEGIESLPRSLNGNLAVYTVASGTSLSSRPIRGESLVGARWCLKVDANSIKLSPVPGFQINFR